MRRERSSISRRTLIGTLIVATTMAMTLPSKGWAMLAPAQVTNERQQTNGVRAADLKTIQTALESKMVRQRLAEFKLSSEEINTRLNQLSDKQIHQTAMQLNSLSPGADGGELLILVLVIAILVALFMYVFKRI